MAFRTRLPISDILHRGLVWSLFGVSVWGIVMIGVVHRNTLAAGRGTREAGGVEGGTEQSDGRGMSPRLLSIRRSDPSLVPCCLEAYLRHLGTHATTFQEEKNEVALAEAAQAALKGRS
ncbi:hypothetical protein C8Q80DRAFT_513000 [Daedaleopsis nitida]|nr:hypothetical protein C8Q80DRAFT_513000 [Daedaleopsis nitida]